jgi:hypothetical protein
MICITPQSEHGVFLINEVLLWKYALNMFQNTIANPKIRSPSNHFKYQEASCDSFLGNQGLVDRLRSTHFDLAIVDLIQNECQEQNSP